MSNRSMARQRILQSFHGITRWKKRVKLMGLAVGVVIVLGSPLHAQHRGGHHGGFRGGHHGGGRHIGLGRHGGHHGGFRHHGSRRHYGGYHGGGLHLDLGHHGRHHAGSDRHLSLEYRNGHHGGSRHHGLRRHRSGHHGDSGHRSDLGHHVDASVVYRPTIHESDHLFDRNYQSSGSTQQRADHGLTTGKRYFKQGGYSLAVESFQRAVLAAPQDGVPKLYFGLAHFAVGDYEYAAYAIRRGMDRVPSRGKDAMDPRHLYGKSADLDRHLAALHAQVERDPANGDAHFLLGYMLYHAGHYSPALEQFDLAPQSDLKDRQAARLRRRAIERTTG